MWCHAASECGLLPTVLPRLLSLMVINLGHKKRILFSVSYSKKKHQTDAGLWPGGWGPLLWRLCIFGRICVFFFLSCSYTDLLPPWWNDQVLHHLQNSSHLFTAALKCSCTSKAFLKPTSWLSPGRTSQSCSVLTLFWFFLSREDFTNASRHRPTGGPCAKYGPPNHPVRSVLPPICLSRKTLSLWQI